MRALHEEHGVALPPRADGDARSSPTRSRCRAATSASTADLVVLGVGVRPSIELAKAAGLDVDRGVVGRRAACDQRAPASSPRATSRAIPTRRRGEQIRVEHWVVAQRHGAASRRATCWARDVPFDGVPFFWSDALRRDASTTSATPRRWDRIDVHGDWPRATRRSPTAGADRRWRSPRSAAITPAWRPRSRSRPATRRPSRRSVAADSGLISV